MKTYDHDSFIDTLESAHRRDCIDRDVRDLGNDTVIAVDRLPDNDADLSFLGKYDSRMEEYTIDRKTGRYYGESTSKLFEIALSDKRWTDDGDLIDTDHVESVLMQWAERAGYDLDDEYTESTFDYSGSWQTHNRSAWLDVSGYLVLADDLGNGWDYRTFRYFHPERASDEEQPEYAVQDFNLMEDINNGSSWVEGVEVTLYIQGEEMDSESIWGVIEPDKSHIAELINELLSDIMYRLPETLKRRREQIAAQLASIDSIRLSNVRSATAIMLLQPRDSDYDWRADHNVYPFGQ